MSELMKQIYYALEIAVMGDVPITLTVDQLKELIAEIDRLKSERRWIPVSERLPENRKQILVFIDGIPDYEGNSLSRITESYYDEKFVCWLGEYVTHWMPLPTPPEDEL